MQRPIVKPAAKNLITGEAIGMIQGQYNLHWNNDFVKTGKEYTYITDKLTPAAQKAFNELIHKHMDFYNMIVTSEGYPMPRSEVKDIVSTTSPRRSNEILLELKDKGFIGEWSFNKITTIVVNPIIAVRASKVDYSLLNLFADYEMIDGKTIRQIYDLQTIKQLEDAKEYREEYGVDKATRQSLIKKMEEQE